MRVQVKLVVFPTDKNKWKHNYCSYCPAIKYFFGRGETIEDVVCAVTIYLLQLLCYRFKYKNLENLGWEIAENSIKVPIFTDEEAVGLAEQSYSTKIVEPKIIVVDVEVPCVRGFY